jgi:hypothetical protein
VDIEGRLGVGGRYPMGSEAAGRQAGPKRAALRRMCTMKVEADVQQEKKERSRQSLTLVCDWSRGSQTFLMNCNTHSLMKTIKVVYENRSFRVFSNNYANKILNQNLDHH